MNVGIQGTSHASFKDRLIAGSADFVYAAIAIMRRSAGKPLTAIQGRMRRVSAERRGPTSEEELAYHRKMMMVDGNVTTSPAMRDLIEHHLAEHEHQRGSCL